VLSLGQAVRKRRDALGLTQEELAERMSQLGDEFIRQSDISRIERGLVQMPRLNRLEILAQVLEMDLTSLFVSAGWLRDTQGESERRPSVTLNDPEGDAPRAPLPSTTIHEVRDRAVRNAYRHLMEALGDFQTREEEFARRKARFREMVEQFEDVRAEMKHERAQEEQDGDGPDVST
jgi:transcriptional regulator with XRE-family HTH domain